MLGIPGLGVVSFRHLPTSGTKRIPGAVCFATDEHGNVELPCDDPLPEFTQKRNRRVTTPRRDDGVSGRTTDLVSDGRSRIAMSMDAAHDTDRFDCRRRNAGIIQGFERRAGHQVDGVDRVIDVGGAVGDLGSADDDRGARINNDGVGHEA